MMISRDQRIAFRPRILLTVLALLYVTNFAEGKLRLVPKDKKKKNLNQKHNLRNTNQQHNKKKSSATKILLKPKKKKLEGPKLQLQATISKNENGEKVLLLTQESAAALSSAMDRNEVVEEKLQEKEPIKEVKKQESLEESETQEHQVLFYDPDELRTAPGELPLPKRVFDADGKEVDMSGKVALLVPPQHEDDVGKDADAPSLPQKDDEPVSFDLVTVFILFSTFLFNLKI
jgi:hypothetical protein